MADIIAAASIPTVGIPTNMHAHTHAQQDADELATPPPRVVKSEQNDDQQQQQHHSSSSSSSSPPASSPFTSPHHTDSASSPPTSPDSSTSRHHVKQEPRQEHNPAAWDNIQPAYFYPTNGHSPPVDETMGIPVFHPTMDQFADFYKYCQAIDSWGMKTGIVKIVPPKEWIEGLPSIRAPDVARQEDRLQVPQGSLPTLESVRIKSAIAQHFTPAAKPGLWRQTNVTRPAKVWNVKQWSEVCKDMAGPSYDRIKDLTSVRHNMETGQHDAQQDESDGVRTRSGKTKVAQAGPSAQSAPQAASGQPPLPPKKRRRVEQPPNPEHESETDGLRTPPVWTPLDCTRKVEDGDEEDQHAQDGEPAVPTTAHPAHSPRRGRSNSHAAAQPAPRQPKVKTADLTTPAEWADFDYRQAWLDEWAQGSSSRPQPADWTPEMCREIEGEYWRNLNFGQPPMYGADLKGTLFTPETQAWNVNSLDNILTRLKLRRKIAGVTDPYLYFGMWRATFAWHVEDMDLYSINYVHFGAPKQWYSIPQKDRLRFETILSSAFPSDARRCSQFMRHKSFLASPSFLTANNIRPLKMVQHAGEFVITYPFGYHSGYNLGFNCAESVNFALESWLDIGRKAKACECEDAQQSVVMDVDALLQESQELELAQRRREERERAKREREEDDADTEAMLERRRAYARNRRAEKKREKMEAAAAAAAGDPAAPSTAPRTKDDDEEWAEEDLPELRLLSEVASSHAQSTTTMTPAEAQKLCCLCPLDSTEDIVPIGECPPGDDEQLYAHALCANSIPECWVAPADENDENSALEVKGYWNIAKARWHLKCTLCTTLALSKAGCCAQCTFGNCARAVHPSCAAMDSSGWFMDMLPEHEADKLESRGKYAASRTAKGSRGKGGKSKSSKGEESASPDDAAVDADAEASERMVILCRAHNPSTRLKDRLRKTLTLRESMKRLPLNASIKVRYANGGKYESKLLAVTDGQALISSGPPPCVKSTIPWDHVIFSKEVADEAAKVVGDALDRMDFDFATVDESVVMVKAAQALDETRPARCAFLSEDEWRSAVEAGEDE